MANEIRTTFYIFVILLYFVRQGDPFGEQNTNAGHFRPEVVFCSPLRRPGEQITNDFRTILLLSFFGSPNKCLGDHFTNEIRNISTFGTPSVFCSFFVRIKSAMATESRMKYEQYSISSLYCRILFARATHLANKIRMRGTFAPKSFFVRLIIDPKVLGLSAFDQMT